MRPMIPAFEFRRRARVAMKNWMPILLVVMLIASLPSLISQTVTMITGADPTVLLNGLSDQVMQLAEKYGMNQAGSVMGEVVIDQAQLEADTQALIERYVQDVETFTREKYPIILGLSLMVMVTSPVLTLGMINAMLHALRKQEVTVSLALSRVRYFLKALGLELLMALKLFAWTLPGLALMIAACFLPEALMLGVMLIGLVLMLVLTIIAAYRYAMVTCLLADDPTVGLRDCFRRSCAIMKQRKLELFGLEISFIGWWLLLSLVKSMLMIFGMVIGSTLGMFAALFLSVYTNCAQVAFYLEYSGAPQGDADAEQMPEMAEMNP